MVRKAILVWWDYWSAQEGVCRTAESAAVAEAAGSESLGHIHHQQRQNYIKTPDNTQSQAPTPTSASTFICRSHKSLLFDFPLKHFHQFHLPPSAFRLLPPPFALRSPHSTMNSSWIFFLLSEKFFSPCHLHPHARKNEKNIFCLDCCLTLCPHCLPLHDSHRLLQVGNLSPRSLIPISLCISLSILFSDSSLCGVGS